MLDRLNDPAAGSTIGATTPHRSRAPFSGGVHDPAWARDACGVAAVARLDNQPRHEVVARGLIALDRLEHRGASGADETTGDGAGILVELSHDFFRLRAPEAGLRAAELPRPGCLAVAVCFFPHERARARELEMRLEQLVAADGHEPITWREVPVDPSAAGRLGREAAPKIMQLLIGAGAEVSDQDEFERRLFLTRRRAEVEFGFEVSFPSFSSRTIVYKGMLTAPQLSQFYPDLTDSNLKSRFAIVHSRFSTNTLPSWELAQPLRMIAHNGEINTALGNVNWMRAREATLSSPLLPGLEQLLPLIPETASDSAAFDRSLELITLAGRSLPHAMMMMVPQAHEERDDLPPELEGFYRYHSRMQEPWDGPAALAFCDGKTLGAMVDRNGLRPGRWLITDDGWLAMGSEAGIFTVPESKIYRKGRFRPGQLVIADLDSGVVHADGEVELTEARRHPYGRWDSDRTRHFNEIEAVTHVPRPVEEMPIELRQLAFGYTQEDLRILMQPLAEQAKEPTGSMGNDVSLAAFSEQEPSLFSYFKQRFAQVTNPAIDPVRETVVMSLTTRLGAKGRLLSLEPNDSFQIEIDHPILTNEDMDRLRGADEPELQAVTIDATFPLGDGPAGLGAAIERICAKADEALAEGATMLIISDTAVSGERVPIPSLLACAAVHQSMVRSGTRLQASLIAESGEPREIHHLAALLGYGTTAINPYLMLESIANMDEIVVGGERLSPDDAVRRAIKGLNMGLRKVLSKIGISTVHSYRGAQIFEAVGLDRDLIDEHFTGTPSRLGGVGIEGLAREAIARHARAWPELHGLALPEHVEEGLLPADHAKLLPQGGVYRWRRDGERHMWDPETIASLQRSVRDEREGAGQESYEEFSRRVNDENAKHALLRGLFGLRTRPEPIPLEEVEPATEIVKRFSTGAMSLGALSKEAHETLAVAMNRIGGFSNSGEGGEDANRNTPDPNGDERRSRIRQVASGRFGVDVDYLSHADQLQIKVAQGAKPGEGGQLPGHKVDDYIARLRHSTPGVELISPPPHHDIYSIEDLKQLIYDLRAANPSASVSVKLAAEAGVGTVAAGVVKAGADHIVIAGHDGGTGASPQSSIQQAGVPWELGLAETQQALLDSELRSRVVLQADGQMRTGRDIVIAALLGADEMGLSTAPLIATGCIMMRVCHLNTCPVGVATQDPELRARFKGTPEQVVTYMLYVAEEARQLIAALGLRSLPELVGRTHLLDPSLNETNWKTETLDLRPLLAVPPVAEGRPKGFVAGVGHGDAFQSFDHRLLVKRYRSHQASGDPAPLEIRSTVTNSDRALGGTLSHAVVGDHGPDGLPEDSIRLRLKGSAGQSCGAWLAPGISLTVEGEVNDYAGKGLSGGVLAVHPAGDSHFPAAENVIAGNVTLYGATRGRAFFGGRAGERFAVRNSGAEAVVEGVGEHACEYMTGGCVVVIGSTGQNFGAGMSGGVAFVHNPDRKLAARTNHQLVDLDPVDAEREGQLRTLLTEHLARTGSEVARELLGRWADAVEEFTLVIPRGYKEAMAKAREDETREREPLETEAPGAQRGAAA